MDEKVTYWLSVAFSMLAVVLLVLNISLVNSNRHMQADLSQRQAMLSRGAAISQMNQSLVQALAEIAVRANDLEVRDLLTGQGITIKPQAQGAADGEASKAKAADDKKKSDKN